MYMSLREAARQFRVGRHWLKGFCDGRRIPLIKVGRMLALTPESFERLKRELAKASAA